MVIDPSNSGINKNGVNTANAGVSKVKPASVHSSSPATTSSRDNVSLSSEAQALGKLERAVGKASDVDIEKVAAIKSSIENGTYTIDSNKVANKMLEQDSQFNPSY